MLPNKKYTLNSFIAIAWNRRRMIGGLLMAGSFVGLLASAYLPDVYQSEMLIQIVPQRVPDSIVRSTITMKTEGRIQTIEQQAKSRTYLEQIIQDLGLYQVERSRLPMEDVVEVMRNHIFVQVIRNERNDPAEAFHVRFQYKEATLAARVTGRLGSLFVDENARERERLSRATNDFLQKQLVEARGRLEAQERKLEQFREQHAGLLPSQVPFNLQTIQSAQLQLQSLLESAARDRDRKLMLERLYNDAMAAPAPLAVISPIPGDSARGIEATGSAQQQLDAARASYARLELRLEPDHPDIIRAKRLVEGLTKKAEAEASQPSNSPAAGGSREELQRQERLQQMRAEIESLDRQIKFKEQSEQQLRATVAQHERRLEALPATESEWVALTRDYDTVFASYKDLLAKSESAKVSADLEAQQIGEQFRVLDPARVPIRPISPIRWQINAIAAGLGLLVGLALTVLFEERDTTYHCEDDVIDVLALPVVALVPYVESAGDQLRRRRRQRVLSTVTGVTAVAGGYAFWAMKLWHYIV
jgi:polysaccharide chain length determinant protein (PEP-CTERM system associated)